MDRTLSSAEVAKADAAACIELQNVRERMRDLTLRLLTEHRLEAQCVRDVLKAISAGLATGASRRPQAASALKEAFSGVDEALSRLAEASRLSLLELQSSGGRFVDEDLKPAVRRMAALERDMLQAFSEAARDASAEAKREITALVEHSTRSGTDTGAVVLKTIEDFSQRCANLAAETTALGVHAGSELSARMLEATLGVLNAVVTALDQKSRQQSIR